MGVNVCLIDGGGGGRGCVTLSEQQGNKKKCEICLKGVLTFLLSTISCFLLCIYSKVNINNMGNMNGVIIFCGTHCMDCK